MDLREAMRNMVTADPKTRDEMKALAEQTGGKFIQGRTMWEDQIGYSREAIKAMPGRIDATSPRPEAAEEVKYPPVEMTALEITEAMVQSVMRRRGLTHHAAKAVTTLRLRCGDEPELLGAIVQLTKVTSVI